MKKFIIIFFVAFCFAACKKSKSSVNELPPITQEGKNTFGCLINGKVFVPKGFEQNHPNFDIIVDPTYSEGSIDIRVFRIAEGINQRINFGSDSIRNIGMYNIGARTDFSFRIYSQDFSTLICETPYSYGAVSSKSGWIKITRYDLVNGILSGEFEFHFSNSDCNIGEPINITQGRFDKKL